MANPILLSTDIGSDIDDALALLVMLNHPKIKLAGVYTVNGDVDSRSCIARHMVNLAGKRIPVLRGESSPLGAVVKPYSLYEEYLVDNSFVDDKKTIENPSRIHYKSLKKCNIIPEGTKNLAERLANGRFTLFSIAPMTGIALILREHPGLVQNIDHLYVMGGEFPEGTMEHNLRFDPVAAGEVLASNIPITIIPGDVCVRYKMPAALMDKAETAVGRYVRHMLRAFVGGKFVIEYGRSFLQEQSLRLLLDYVEPNFKEDGEKSLKELLKLNEKKEGIIANWDVEAAYGEAKNFLEKVYWLIEQLKDPKNQFYLGELAAQTIESLIPKEVSAHDVFIPYCFLHPERLKTRRMTVDCDMNGKTLIQEGEKHEVVTDLDFNHFEEFVQTYIK